MHSCGVVYVGNHWGYVFIRHGPIEWLIIFGSTCIMKKEILFVPILICYIFQNIEHHQ